MRSGNACFFFEGAGAGFGFGVSSLELVQGLRFRACAVIAALEDTLTPKLWHVIMLLAFAYGLHRQAVGILR